MKEEIKNMKEKNTIKWFDDANKMINIIIGNLLLIIILSQAFAVNNNLGSSTILRDLLNHNSIYLLGLVYFIPLKTMIGKKYFNYFNIFIILVYIIYSITSLLTLIQSFSLLSIVTFSINIVFLVYMVHVLLKNTRVYEEFKLKTSPFNEISSENYFYSLVILSVIYLAINLIEVSTVDGAIISVLTTVYNCLVGRYVYLYSKYKKENKLQKIFDNIIETAKDLPKFKTVKNEVSSMKVNNYQKLSIAIFFICFVVGIIFGNLFPSCSSSYSLYDTTCTDTEFNLSLTVLIWFISFLVCLFFYGLGEIIALLTSINQKLSKK